MSAPFFLVDIGKGFWAKLERNTLQCFSKSEVVKVVGLGVGAKSKLEKRFCITIKYLFVTGIPDTKRGQLNYS
jgi:hypothetical protein